MRKRKILPSFISSVSASRTKAGTKETGTSFLALLPLLVLLIVGYQLALDSGGQFTSYPVASAASPETSFLFQASGDVTKTGRDITTNSYTVTLPGRRIAWVISAGNSTDQAIPNYTIVDPIRDGQKFVVGSLQVPPGWTKERSNDNGNTWGYTPVAGADGTDPAVTHIRSVGTLVPSPSTGVTGTIGSLSLPAQLVSGGGDGWRPIFNFERNRIYVVNHHEIPRRIDGSGFGSVIKCVDTQTNSQCSGFPKYVDGGSGYTIGTTHNPYEWVDSLTNRFYFFGYTSADGINTQWGVACFDMAANTPCGFTPVAGVATLGELSPTYDGFTMLALAGKFYVFNRDGQALCLTWPGLASCGTLDNVFSSDGYTGPDALVSTVVDAQANRLYAVRSYYNVTDQQVQAKLTCIDLTSATLCPGIGLGGKLVLQGSAAPRWGGKSHPWFWQDASGNNQHICVVGNNLMASVPGGTPGIACYDLTSFSYSGAPPGLINYAALNVPSGYTISFTQGRNFGSRLYQPAWIANDSTSQWFRDSRDLCYDFATQAACSDWNNNTGQPLDWAFGEPAGYEYTRVGNCYYGFGHNGILWSFDQDGTTPCRAEQSVQLSVNPAPYYCDGLTLAQHNVEWGSVRLLSQKPSGMTRLTADVYDGATDQLLVSGGDMLAGGGLSLAGINFAQHPTLRVQIQGAGSWASSLSVGVFWTGDAPQICFQTLIPQGYTYTVVTNTVQPPGSPPVTHTLSIPRLVITKDVDKNVASPGDVLTYTLNVTNTSGPGVRLNPVSVSDPNPVAGATLVAGSIVVEPASRAASVGSSLPDLATLNLASGEAAKITFQLKLPTTGLTNNQVITNTATATPPSWTGLLPVQDDAVTKIVIPSDPTGSEKKVSGNSGPSNETHRGDVLTYTIRLLNNTGTPASSVTVSDTLDVSLTNLRQVSNNGVYDSATRTITWSGLNVPGATGNVPGELLLTYVVDVASSAGNGTLVPNRANVLYDGRELKLDAPDLVVKVPPLLSTAKTVVGNSGPGNQTKPGDTLTYTISITNSETVAATGVTASDPIDPALEVPPVSISNSGSFNATSRKIDWTGLTVPAAISGTNTVTPGVITLSFVVKVPLSTPDGTRINNVATITPPTGTGQPPLDARAPELIVKIPGLGTPTKEVSGQSGPGYSAKPGDTITYSISLFNPGNMIASGITVTDELDPALETPTDISNGGSYDGGSRRLTWLNLSVPAATSASEPGKLVISFRAKVKVSATAGTRINNTGIVTTPPGTGGGGTPKAPELTVTKPDLSPSAKGVSGQSGPGNNVKVGDIVTYAITTTNSGNREATGVVVSDTLVSYLEDPTDISDGGQFNASTRTITWSGLAIVAGQNKVVTFKAKVRNPTGSSSGTITNTVVIVPPGWTGDPPVKRDAPQLQLGKPDLSGSTKGATLGTGSVVVSGTVVSPGQVFTYTISVKNSGNAAATGVTVTDKLDTSLLLLDDPAGNPIGQNGSYDTATGTLTWANLTIPAGGEVLLTVRVKVRQTATGGAKINNTAVCSVPVEGGNGCNPSAPPVIVGKPGIELKKTVRTVLSSKADGKLWPGDTVEYTVRLSNPGPLELTNLVFTDGYDYQTGAFKNMQGTTYVGNSVTATLEPAPATTDGNPQVLGQPVAGKADGNLVIKVPKFLVNQVLLIKFQVKLSSNPDDIKNGQIINQATTTADETMRDPLTNSDTRQLLSDDPTTSELSDPTIAKVSSATVVQPLPTVTPTPPPLPAQTGPDGRPLVASENLTLEPANTNAAGSSWWLFVLISVGLLTSAGAGACYWLVSKLRLKS